MWSLATFFVHTFVNNTYPQLQIIIKYFKKKNWIDSSQKVLTRKVAFSETTNDAIAKICLVDKSTGGNVIYLIGNEVWYYYSNSTQLCNLQFANFVDSKEKNKCFIT